MLVGSQFFREQQAIELHRATVAPLDNAKKVAMRAAEAWARQAVLAERLETVAALRLANSQQAEQEFIHSENPDRGHAN